MDFHYFVYRVRLRAVDVAHKTLFEFGMPRRLVRWDDDVGAYLVAVVECKYGFALLGGGEWIVFHIARVLSVHVFEEVLLAGEPVVNEGLFFVFSVCPFGCCCADGRFERGEVVCVVGLTLVYYCCLCSVAVDV